MIEIHNMKFVIPADPIVSHGLRAIIPKNTIQFIDLTKRKNKKQNYQFRRTKIAKIQFKSIDYRNGRTINGIISLDERKLQTHNSIY